MPFGLTNAPAAFQSFIQWVLWEFLDITCIIYLDDILVFSHTQEEHDLHVLQILQVLDQHGLLASVDKCEFDKDSLEYLSFILGKDGIAMHPSKLTTISKWPEPRSVKDIQQFLGLANFYHCFISHYALIAAPLYELTCKNTPSPFTLTDKAHQAFTTLKSSFLSAPILTHHDPSKQTFLFMDASNFAISGIPHQEDEGRNLHPLCFFSQKLDPAEINYGIHDKEMLGVMESLQEFRHWLSGTVIPVLVITDHKNLEYFMTSHQLNQRQACWSLELTKFNFKLSWIPGSKNPANAPSRRPDYTPQEGDNIKNANYQALLKPYHMDLIYDNLNSIPSNPSSLAHSPTLVATIMHTIDTAPPIGKFKKALASDPTWHEALGQEAGNQHKNWSQLDDFVLFHDQIYVPPSLHPKILFQYHDSPLAGHPGCAKTIKLVACNYSWPGMTYDIHWYIENRKKTQGGNSALSTLPRWRGSEQWKRPSLASTGAMNMGGEVEHGLLWQPLSWSLTWYKLLL